MSKNNKRALFRRGALAVAGLAAVSVLGTNSSNTYSYVSTKGTKTGS